MHLFQPTTSPFLIVPDHDYTIKSHLTWPWLLVEPARHLFQDIQWCCPNRDAPIRNDYPFSSNGFLWLAFEGPVHQTKKKPKPDWTQLKRTGPLVHGSSDSQGQPAVVVYNKAITWTDPGLDFSWISHLISTYLYLLTHVPFNTLLSTRVWK